MPFGLGDLYDRTRLIWSKIKCYSTPVFKWQFSICFMLPSVSQIISSYQISVLSPSCSRSELKQLGCNTLWQVEKSPAPHIWWWCSSSSGTKRNKNALFSQPPLNRKVMPLTWYGGFIPLLLSSLFLYRLWGVCIFSFLVEVVPIEKLRLHFAL